MPRIEVIDKSWKVLQATTIDGKPLVGIHPLVEWRRDDAEDRREDLAKDDEDRREDLAVGDDKKSDITPLPDERVVTDTQARRRTPIDDEEEKTSLVRFILPNTLKEGESVRIVVQYEDTWGYGNGSDGLKTYIPYPMNSRPGQPTPFHWERRDRLGCACVKNQVTSCVHCFKPWRGRGDLRG